MKKLLNWLMVLGACVGAFYGIGLIVPRSQSLGCKTSFVAKPTEIFATIADVKGWPDWFPGVVAAEVRPAKNDHPIWRLTTPRGETFELEVTASEEPGSWSATFTRDGTRSTLRADLTWYGEGGRVRILVTTDTRDPWLRARHFLLPHDAVTALEVMNALAECLGEKPSIKEGN